MSYTYLVGNMQHQLIYIAEPSSFKKYHDLVLKSMETHIPSDATGSRIEIIKHSMAKYRELAELSMSKGDVDMAAKEINEGLKWGPSDPRLLEFKAELERSQRSGRQAKRGSLSP